MYKRFIDFLKRKKIQKIQKKRIDNFRKRIIKIQKYKKDNEKNNLISFVNA